MIKKKFRKVVFSPYVLSTVYCLLVFCGCSFPRIIVLDDPLSPEEHLNLGVAYEQNKEYESALKEYEKASKQLPVAYLYMGNIHFSKNEYAEAESYYRRAIDEDPKNADAYNNLAWLYYTERENLREAEELVLKAIEINPEKKDIYQDTLEKIREAIKDGLNNQFSLNK
jgi:tetratricopeptide (TPR) repeat protein